MTVVGDMMELKSQVTKWSLADFQQHVDVAEVVRIQREYPLDPADGWTNLLYAALRNRDVKSRQGIATALLDAGWRVNTEPKGANELLLLFEHGRLDPELDADLARRLLELGCDPLALERRGDRPVAKLVTRNQSDAELQPFYDALFAVDDLDLSRQATNGVSVWRSLMLTTRRVQRASFLQQARDHAERRGRTLPALGESPKTNDPV